MDWLIIVISLGASALALVAIAWRDRNTIGYEDEDGFHYGTMPDDSLDDLEWPEKRQGGRRG